MRPPQPFSTSPANVRPVAPTIPAAPPHAKEGHSAEHEGEDRLREFFRERLFAITSLSLPLQIAVGCAIGFCFDVACLVLLHHVLQPDILIQFDMLSFGIAPLATVIMIQLFWIVGWSLALTGALHGNWIIRVVVFLVFAFIVAQSFTASQNLTSNLISLTYGWPLIVLAIYAIVIIALTARERAGRMTLPAFLPRLSFVVISALLVLFYASFYISLAVIGGGGQALVTESLTHNFEAVIFLILPAYFLAGSDFVEWAQVSSREASYWLRLRERSPWLLFAATALVAGVILWYLLAQRGDLQGPAIFAVLDIVEMVLIGVVVCSVLFLIARWGQIERLRSSNIPFLALAGAALSVFGLVVLALMLGTITSQIGSGPALALAFIDVVFRGDGTILLGIMPLLVAVLVGVPLLATGRNNRPALASAGFFLIVFGLRSALLYFAHILQLFGLPTQHLPVHVGSFSAHTTIPGLNLPMIQIIAALFTLLYLLWLLVRRAPRSYLQDMLAQLFILNVGLQLINWVSLGLAASGNLSPVVFPSIAALLLVLAFLWDLLTSGEQTNGNSRRMPRYTRVCVYVGYSMLAITITLYLSIAPTAASSSNIDPETWTPSGVTDLGVAMLLTGFVIGVCRARARARTTAAQGLRQNDRLAPIPANQPRW